VIAPANHEHEESTRSRNTELDSRNMDLLLAVAITLALHNMDVLCGPMGRIF
jgi:hypothetical protein